MKKFLPYLLPMLLLLATPVAIAQITVPNSFSPNTTILSAQVNANFAKFADALNRTGGTMTGTLNSLDVLPTIDGQSKLGDATHRFTALWLSSPLTIASGGTNSSATPTNGGVGYGTGTAHAYSAAGTAGQVLLSNGAAAPTWGANSGTTSTITTTGTQTQLALPSGSGNLTIFANNASALTVQGIAAGLDGQLLTIYSIGAGQVNLVHQSGSATAADRLINYATSGNTPLAAGSGSAVFRYDATAARWRMLAHEQGAWITPTFAAGDYTAEGGGSWTVGSGDVLGQAYWLKGRTLTVAYTIDTMSVATTATVLVIGNGAWGGFTAAKLVESVMTYQDGAGGNETFGRLYVLAAGTGIKLTRGVGSATWSASINQATTRGQLTFEVQ